MNHETAQKRKRPKVDQFLDQLPPHSLESEKAVIGSILLDPNTIDCVVAIVGPESFYADAHRKLFGSLLAMRQDGVPIDVALLVERLREQGDFEAIGGSPYLAEIAQGVPTAANAAYYAKVVLEKSQRRMAIDAAATLLREANNGHAVHDVLADAIGRLETIASGAPATQPRLERLTTGELFDTCERPTYLIPGVLVDGQPGVLAGYFKDMKTSVGMDLAVSLAIGGQFLGYFPVSRPTRVGFISGESGQATLVETVDRIALAADVDPRAALSNLIWATQVPRLRDPADQEAIRQFIADDGLGALFIDPLYLCLAGMADAASLYMMGEALTPLAEIGRDTNCTVIVLHHTSRGASRQRGFNPAMLGDLAYSGVSEFVRQWLLLSRRAEYTAGSGHHELWLSAGGSAGHSGLWALDIDEGRYESDRPRTWHTSVRTASVAHDRSADALDETRQKRSDEQLDRDKRAVLDAVLKCPDRRGTQTDIRNRCGRNGQAFARAFAALLSSGDLVECAIQKTSRRAPYQGYSLRENWDAN